jgi:hypothetical protein
MDSEKHSTAPFDSSATTPTRQSHDRGLLRTSSWDALREEKTNELHVMESRTRSQTRAEPNLWNENSSGEGLSDKDIERNADAPTLPNAQQAVSPKDPSLVEWDGPDDPENPQNWRTAKKWYITMILSTLTFCITFSSSVFSQATAETAREYGVSLEVTTLGTSLFVLVCSPS